LSRYKEGTRDVTKALELDREIGTSAVSLIVRDGLLISGMMQEKAGQRRQAFDIYHQATKLQPNDGKAEYALVLLSARNAGMEDGGKVWQACNRIRFQKPEYASCQEMLSEAKFPKRAGTRIETQPITFEAIVTGIVAAIGTAVVIGASHDGNASSGSGNVNNPPIPIPRRPWIDSVKCANTVPAALAGLCF
jgi:hypothetical protein